ncbi:MAG: hypothetical protein KBS76_01040 [Ruminococcus sp.]|nr:hypothetical protein [Candidatus Apopatosoma intestinale]
MENHHFAPQRCHFHPLFLYYNGKGGKLQEVLGKKFSVFSFRFSETDTFFRAKKRIPCGGRGLLYFILLYQIKKEDKAKEGIRFFFRVGRPERKSYQKERAAGAFRHCGDDKRDFL